MAHEILLAVEYLTTVLSGDSTLMGYAPGGVYRSEVPATAAVPYIVLGSPAGKDILTMNAFRIFSTMLIRIEVIGPTSLATSNLAPAVAEIDRLLGRVSGLPLTADSKGLILTGYRETPTLSDSLVNGEDWLAVGGMYRMQIQSIG